MKSTDQRFSICAVARAKATGTWGKIDSHEFRVISDLIESGGLPNSGYDPIPGHALAQRATPLTTASPNGGDLDGVALLGYLPALQAQCNVLKLGATPVALGKGNATMPRGVAPIVPTWLADEVTPTVATAPTFGSLSFTRKNMLVSVTLSRQQLLQSDADAVVNSELRRSFAAEIDKQAIQGTGVHGLPLGLLNNPLIANVSGTALAYSTIVSSMVAVANSNAVVDADSLGFLTTPTVAGLLKQRYYSAANFRIWEGSVVDGTIDDMTAVSSTNVPSGALIHADWSRLFIGSWDDGLQIDVDPFTGFQNASVTIRLCASIDFQIASPLSFNIISGVT